MERATGPDVCDRRILKAFYTQYVAVLLIILVFSVGAFQRSSSKSTPEISKVLTIQDSPSIGTLHVRPDFNPTGSLVGQSPELEAIAWFVREHDIRATITLATSTNDESADLADVENALARIDALRAYFISQGLPDTAFQYVLGGPVAQEGNVTVQFEELHYDNLPL